MKKKLLHILFTFILGFAVSSCVDDLFGGDAAESRVNMKLTISLPGAASAATRTTTEVGSDDENKISGIRLFVFQNNRLAEEVVKDMNVAGNTITATTENPYKGNIEIAVIANHSKSIITLGMSKEDFYKALVYTYGEQPWTLSETQRIPMWGKLDMDIKTGINSGTIPLYRAVAKMDVQVNKGEGLDNFSMKSIRVYYSQKKGYSAPLVANQPTVPGSEVLAPSMIGEQRTKEQPLIYLFKETVNSYHQIYVPEANNVTLGNDQKALCLVVGGIYTGDGLVEAGKESYYRIDLKNEDKVPFDVLRNYLYRLNINSVSNPGTPSPEEALDHAVAGLEVSIEAWNETYMDGLSNQYSLMTSASRLVFAKEAATQSVTVVTDYATGWELYTPAELELPAWITVTKEGDKLVVKAEPNYGAGREASIYVKAGSLRKLIIVEQGQPESANCYIVSSTDKTVHDLVVTIKGNGSQGLYAEDKDQSKKVLLDENGAAIAPTKVKVIWETNEGLIKITKNTPDPTTGAIQYKVDQVGTIDGVQGGNALIGAFNEAGTLLWSWHIWVCPAGIKDEKWTLTGYNVMDRNLGAVSNQPGVGSLGLLYQWGRKDPFIGAGAIQIGETSGVMPTINDTNYPWEIGESEGIAYTIQHPTKLTKEGLSVSETQKGPYLWGTNGGLNKESIKELGVKTIYDPCPAGYRVPPVDAFVFKREPFEGARNAEDQKLDRYYSKKLGEEWVEYTPDISNVYDDGEDAYIYISKTADPKHSDAKYEYQPKFIGGVTIWYNVPVFTIEKTSELHNWNENLTYVPYNNDKWESLSLGKTNKDYLTSYDHQYPEGGKYYGYHINYQTIVQPEIDMNQKEGNYYYKLKSASPSSRTISWLPLSGAYDPKNEKGFTFQGVTIERGSSLTVNSFIWTNSSIKSKNDILRPAALFLHGAEKDPTDGNNGNGRHIHGMTQDDIKAEPNYAGAVRCVKDEKKDFGDTNKVPAEVSIGGKKGNTTLIDGKAFVAVNDSWQVIDPGASWFYLTPDRGLADKNKGTTITITALADNTTNSSRTATVKIKFSDESIREMKVTQGVKQ